MNRAQRRARARAEARRRDGSPVVSGPLFIGAPEVIEQLALRCADCNSEADYWRDDDGRHVDLLHDDTCPAWRALQREAAK